MKAQKQKIICALSLICLFSLIARAADNPPPRLITVAGQAEVQVVPDEVVFRLEVETVDRDLSASKAANDESVKKVLTLARSYQIEPQNVQTNYISVEKRYASPDETKSRRREFLGYAVSKTVVITLKDISRFENLFADVLKAGVTEVSNVEFRTTQIRKLKDQARALAIRAAQEKASALASEIGQKIGKAYTISEEGLEAFSRSRTNSFTLNGDNNNSNYTANTTNRIGGSFSDNEGTIAPGTISVSARVIVSFELD